MKGRNLIGILCTGALAHGQGGLHIQRTLHPAVQHGTACFTGGGKVGARHAAPQGDDGRAQDLYRAFHVELTAAQSQVGPSVRMGLCTTHSSRTDCTGSLTTVRTVRPCQTASNR